MQYKRVTQTSGIYRYGKGKRFRTRETAMAEAERVKKGIQAEIRQKHSDMNTEVKILETEDAVQVVLHVFVPLKKEN